MDKAKKKELLKKFKNEEKEKIREPLPFSIEVFD